jgi:hypothetical protein
MFLKKKFQQIIGKMLFNLTKFRKNLFKVMYIYGRKNIFVMYFIESTLKINLIFFPFAQISMKYEILKLMFMQCLKSSMG